MSATPRELRAEFPHCDLGYVRNHCPDATSQAEAYNRARGEINPAEPKTIERARAAKTRLFAAVES